MRRGDGGRALDLQRHAVRAGLVHDHQAAALATGLPAAETGEEIHDPVRLPPIAPERLPDGSLRATVLHKAFRGAEILYTLRLASGRKVLALVPSHHNHAIGERIGIRLDVDHVVAFQPEA